MCCKTIYLQGKKRKAKGKTPKTSQFKLANKRTTKLAKQGKLKKRKKKNTTSNYEDKKVRQNDTDDDNDFYDEDDVEYFSGKKDDISFVSNIQNSLLSSDADTPKRKRKRDNTEELDATYEKLPRKLSALNHTEKMLLPIKTKQGIVPQSTTEHTDTGIPNGVESERPADDKSEQDNKELLPELSNIELFALRQQKLEERKKRIAILSSSVIENPESNMKKLRELRVMLEESDPDVYLSVRKLVMVSLKEVFKDIVPGYRIRMPTQEEKQQKLKKETKELYSYEESFLLNYRYYLEFLERCVKGRGKVATTNISFQKKLEAQRKIPAKSINSFREIGLQCLCEMLINHPHFNYRNNIITVVVPFMNKGSEKLSEMVCDTVKTVYKGDKSGEVSLEVLDTFLSLKISKIDLSSEEGNNDGKKGKENFKKLSKREKKKRKQKMALEHELLETKATEDKKKRQKLYTEITQLIFFIYFRIIKTTSKSILLPSVLEGLAKFAHLINVDFFDDLFQAFNDLIDSGNLTYRECLHCVQTSFTILSGQGSALNIDPMRFYTHLYNTLFKVHTGCSSEDISQQRVLAFIKRLCSLCLLQRSNSCLALLAVVRNLILRHYSPIVKKYNDNISRQATTTGQGQLHPELSRREVTMVLFRMDFQIFYQQPYHLFPRQLTI
ncbi:hypothetical protein KUTeg_004967 [Tegillarca granosa]|uniref:NOC3-like protein n=1 Tax=Tegillarca granosa TaxID=220873 RepID=A0ABQ9FIF0_TEGGR|nr:hypothetical protein KUTeg_004967 [Tegillarca granosa]